MHGGYFTRPGEGRSSEKVEWSPVISWLYRFILYPLAFALLQLLSPFLNRKTKEMVSDKNSSFFKLNGGQEQKNIAALRPFWIHAASGEIEYARPVIRELKNKFPNVPIIVTYSSPSAKKILSGLSEIDAWGALPWDFQASCDAFLQTWQPRCFLVARTDVWPVMTNRCASKKIPSLLFAATFAENSSRLHGISGRITEWALNSLSEIHCVSEDDVLQLKRLNIRPPVQVHGDTRFDQVFYRLQHPKPTRSELKYHGDKAVFVAGSTWPEDEKVLVPAYASVKNRCKFLLVPHEIHESHLLSLEKNLEEYHLTFCRYSQAQSWQTEDVLIVDQVGILAELYTWGTFAFVGGSFRKQIHSVMEPLAAGLPVLVGPFHANNREALQFKKEKILNLPVVQEVREGEDFANKINLILREVSPKFRQELQQSLQQHRSSSQYVVGWCAKSVSN